MALESYIHGVLDNLSRKLLAREVATKLDSTTERMLANRTWAFRSYAPRHSRGQAPHWLGA